MHTRHHRGSGPPMEPASCEGPGSLQGTGGPSTLRRITLILLNRCRNTAASTANVRPMELHRWPWARIRTISRSSASSSASRTIVSNLGSTASSGDESRAPSVVRRRASSTRLSIDSRRSHSSTRLSAVRRARHHTSSAVFALRKPPRWRSCLASHRSWPPDPLSQTGDADRGTVAF